MFYTLAASHRRRIGSKGVGPHQPDRDGASQTSLTAELNTRAKHRPAANSSRSPRAKPAGPWRFLFQGNTRNRFVREKFRLIIHGLPERNALDPVVVRTQDRGEAQRRTSSRGMRNGSGSRN